MHGGSDVGVASMFLRRQPLCGSGAELQHSNRLLYVGGLSAAYSREREIR
jgi:hypothetical protein